ncbi:helix-turn-helix domain-containing protein [Enterococcus columbae]|uniref:HTH cro/C1-type domain-containing protein n=1 Tax=Enterococcus columbae DSM 7374 = ATCC 51263 TaxID=1121865 RepID=S0KWV0_9ENTE|nr:helix-turn-helix domain-containing protein [Enterococcus columbae]EOT44593.1 hypothetical protein OMW_00649 [Enterococcus columbae DSM 7374 = ATCC 51263]EOW87511.1 hypothetical protein I568_00555 [Enterococcus columbae DSM 7374 = ATCC 51263]OJG25167.1 hypothetical protein RR47_GL001955 [Enterococcus columbae DSM 7374 = ATCC 51263]
MPEYISGDLLKSLRIEQKLSQKKLADLVGISQSLLAKYEKGTIKIPKAMDVTLSKILNVETLLKNEPDNMQDLIKQVVIYKKMNNLLNKELANKIGISEVSLGYILNGKRKPSQNILKKIVAFLSTDAEKSMAVIKQSDGSFKFPVIDKAIMGKRIYEIRDNRDTSLAKFGKEFTYPVRKNVIHRWENGENVPDIEKLMNLAYLGKVTVPYILYGELFSNMLTKGNKIDSFEKIDSLRMGLRLRKIRSDYHLSREDFGKFFSPPISKWTMDRYENGHDIPNTERIIQYAFIGKVSLEFLVYGI